MLCCLASKQVVGARLRVKQFYVVSVYLKNDGGIWGCNITCVGVRHGLIPVFKSTNVVHGYLNFILPFPIIDALIFGNSSRNFEAITLKFALLVYLYTNHPTHTFIGLKIGLCIVSFVLQVPSFLPNISTIFMDRTRS